MHQVYVGQQQTEGPVDNCQSPVTVPLVTVVGSNVLAAGPAHIECIFSGAQISDDADVTFALCINGSPVASAVVVQNDPLIPEVVVYDYVAQAGDVVTITASTAPGGFLCQPVTQVVVDQE